jgi:hypothetical protein
MQFSPTSSLNVLKILTEFQIIKKELFQLLSVLASSSALLKEAEKGEDEF